MSSGKIIILTIQYIWVGDKMKNDLINLIIKDCCKGRECDECPFSHSDFKCYLTAIINIIKNYKKENK